MLGHDPTRNSQITVFMQNAALEYEWIINPRLGFSTEDVIGKSDYELLPIEAQPLVVGHKNRALTTRSTQSFEIEVDEGTGRSWFRVDVVPLGDSGAEPIGVVCTAIDITRAKRLDAMRIDLSRRLSETLQRFNLALRSERIVVFSQDLAMRYTWANSDETQIGSVIGRTDDEVIPPEDRPPIAALKERAIATKKPQSGEVGIGVGAARRWYDLHVEPNLQPDGKVSGITCASIDVTHRRKNEERMRLVMRELTHRTKNLLAVVIAIARQTSTRATDVGTFVPSLIGRLRALSVTQDLIVADDWAGVGFDDLVRGLLALHCFVEGDRLKIGGPNIVLSPEASQNIGLAINELASNAVKYGSLFGAQGEVAISWTVTEQDGNEGLVVKWLESGGPPVSAPRQRGFGMLVIERNLTQAAGAEVSLEFAPDGLCATMVLPLNNLMPGLNQDQVELARTA